MAVLGLRFCARAFSSCGKWGPLFIVVCGPLTIAASLVAEPRLQTRRLSNCGSRAQLLRGMWDLPRPGLEPVSPALAGRFSTTAPPGKPCLCFILVNLTYIGDSGKFSRIELVVFIATFFKVDENFILCYKLLQTSKWPRVKILFRISILLAANSDGSFDSVTVTTLNKSIIFDFVNMISQGVNV